jgi:hypothetical protein
MKILLATLRRILILVMTLVLVGCGNDTSPSTTSTTTTSVATTTTSVATTTIPTSFTLSGTMTDATTSQPVTTASEVEILDGSRAGQKFPGTNGAYSITGLTAGTFTARFRAVDYQSADRQVTIGNANVMLNVPLQRNPLVARFTWAPDPCQLTNNGSGGVTTNCLVNGSSSSGFFMITGYAWSYPSSSGTGQAHNLTLSCGNDPGSQRASVPVTLTVTDSSGASVSTTQTVPALKTGVCGF